MANSVSKKLFGFVAAIFAKSNAILSREFQNRFLRLIQQRTDQFDGRIRRRNRFPFHARQSFVAASAQEAKEEQFGLIVCVMRQGNGRNPKPFRRCREKPVPHLASRHFDGDIAVGRRPLHITVTGYETNAVFLRQLSNEPFICIRCSAAKLMIEMRNSQLPVVGLLVSQCDQDVKQHHGIDAARNRDEYRLSRQQESMRND